MNDEFIIKSFEEWHKKQNVSKNYKLSYERNRNNTEYKDYRTNWAYLAFKAGYRKSSIDSY